MAKKTASPHESSSEGNQIAITVTEKGPRARVGIFRKGGIFRQKKNQRHCAVAVYPAANPIATARTSRGNGIRRSPPEKTGLRTK